MREGARGGDKLLVLYIGHWKDPSGVKLAEKRKNNKGKRGGENRGTLEVAGVRARKYK